MNRDDVMPNPETRGKQPGISQVACCGGDIVGTPQNSAEFTEGSAGGEEKLTIPAKEVSKSKLDSECGETTVTE